MLSVGSDEWTSTTSSRLFNLLCILTSKRMLAHAFACRKRKKHLKMMKKVPFTSCAREAHVRPMKKNEFFFLFLHEPYMSLAYAWWKRYFFYVFEYFSSFLTIRMHSLIEIHNINLSIPLSLKISVMLITKCKLTVDAPTANAMTSVMEVTVMPTPAWRRATPNLSVKSSIFESGLSREWASALFQDCMMTNMSSIPGKFANLKPGVDFIKLGWKTFFLGALFKTSV